MVKSGGDHDGNVRGMKRSKRRLSWISRHRPTNSVQVGSPRPSPRKTSKTSNVEDRSATKRKNVKDELDVLESQRNGCTRLPSAGTSTAQRPYEQDKNQDVQKQHGGENSDNCINVEFQNELAKIYEAASYFNHQSDDGVQSDLQPKQLTKCGAFQYSNPSSVDP